MKSIQYKDLSSFTYKLLLKIGLNNFSAKSVSFGLCETSLRGVDSHGIKLLPHYCDSAINGRKNPNPKFKFTRKFPSFGILDADNGFGHAAGMKAIDLCIKIAKKNGVGIVAVQNSSHPGALASMTLKAAREGYAAFAFTHANSLMLTYNGKNSFFGTNPICFACPRSKSEPYCLDMATTNISWNKLLNYKNQNKKLQKNLAADKYGKETIFPDIAKALLPIGGYKGFGLASMVDILCGVMTNMPYGSNILPMYNSSLKKKRHLGQFYIVFRVDACMSKNKFKNRVLEMSKKIRTQKKSKKNVKIMVPNDPEIISQTNRLKKGIPISNDLYLKLVKLSQIHNTKLKFIK